MSHPTLRHLLGAGAPAALPRSTALLVIDFQNEYFDGALPIPDGAAALAQARRLVAHADRHGWPVVHVQHEAPADSLLFAEGSRLAEFHTDSQPGPAHLHVRKRTVSVFASTNLDALLKARGVTHLLICGLMTHACVAGAARDAVPLGFEVVVAADACATRTIRRADGTLSDKDAQHRAALATIEDTFGAVLDSDDILRLPVA